MPRSPSCLLRRSIASGSPGWPTHYPWIDSGGLQYFRSRLPLATRDVQHGLKVTLEYFVTRQAQLRALDILQFKLDLLWSMLDAIQLRYGLPMNNPSPLPRSSYPRIAPLYRFQWEAAQNAYVLLFPEGMVQLNVAAGEILRRCDGKLSTEQIIADLRSRLSVRRH